MAKLDAIELSHKAAELHDLCCEGSNSLEQYNARFYELRDPEVFPDIDTYQRWLRFHTGGK